MFCADCSGVIVSFRWACIFSFPTFVCLYFWTRELFAHIVGYTGCHLLENWVLLVFTCSGVVWKRCFIMPRSRKTSRMSSSYVLPPRPEKPLTKEQLRGRIVNLDDLLMKHSIELQYLSPDADQYDNLLIQVPAKYNLMTTSILW